MHKMVRMEGSRSSVCIEAWRNWWLECPGGKWHGMSEILLHGLGVLRLED
jgi:hypothetical protein